MTPSNALDDRVVLTIAHDVGRILITNDRDFGELVFRQRRPHAGAILFRLTATDLPSTIARLAAVLPPIATGSTTSSW